MFGMLPFERSEDNVFDTFDNFARNFFRSSNTNLPAFRTDIRDAGDKFILEAELPGFDKGDIKLDVKDGILTITAEHSENQDQKDDKGTYIRRERRYGSFSRSFDITGINEAGITAAYNNGILTITAEHSENQDQKDDKGTYIRRERRYGSFSRSFDITGINEAGITAAYNNGILELNLPKAVPVVPESRRIAID